MVLKGIIYLIILAAVTTGSIYFLLQVGDEDAIEGINFDQEQMEKNKQEETQPTQSEENKEGQQEQEPMEYDGTKVMAQIMKEGTGEVAKNGDKITAHYTGYLEDGAKFDSSVDRGQPFQFNLGAGQVIAGWELGIAGMKIGEVRRLIIPPQFGYGEQGSPGSIPPNATLIFDVELLGIN